MLDSSLVANLSSTGELKVQDPVAAEKILIISDNNGHIAVQGAPVLVNRTAADPVLVSRILFSRGKPVARSVFCCRVPIGGSAT